MLSFSILPSHKDTIPLPGKKLTLHPPLKKGRQISSEQLSTNICFEDRQHSMKRCMHKYLYNYITVNDIVTLLQFGFRHGDSTANQILHTYHTICEAVDKGKEVRAVICYISKAFNSVWYKSLLFKLHTIGCSDHTVNGFLSYLSNRRQ